MNYFISVPDTEKFIARRLHARERGCDPGRYEGLRKSQVVPTRRISAGRATAAASTREKAEEPRSPLCHFAPEFYRRIQFLRSRKREAGERSCLTPLLAVFTVVDMALLQK